MTVESICAPENFRPTEQGPAKSRARTHAADSPRSSESVEWGWTQVPLVHPVPIPLHGGAERNPAPN